MAPTSGHAKASIGSTATHESVTTSSNMPEKILSRLVQPTSQDDDDDHDEQTCSNLSALTKLFAQLKTTSPRPAWTHLDDQAFRALLRHLDIRASSMVRGHATLTVAAYLKNAQDGDGDGVAKLSSYFHESMRRDAAIDRIEAFSVASALFPVVPEVIAPLFLTEGFVQSLEGRVNAEDGGEVLELAVLELLSAACMRAECRELVQKHCAAWLEKIMHRPVDDTGQDGHARVVHDLAVVILAKLQAISSKSDEDAQRTSSTTVQDLSQLLKNTMLTNDAAQLPIEGLAYTSIRPEVKEQLASDAIFLQRLVSALKTAPPKSPNTFGALTIFTNLTRYAPIMTEEQRKMSQLKAYANAAKVETPHALEDDAHVAKRCLAVFRAGLIPILVTHSQNGSLASLGLIVGIVNSMSRSTSIRGTMAQQGAIKMLLHIHAVTTSHAAISRTAAHALARILISTNPLHVFGGSNPISLTTAIRPLTSLLTPSGEESTPNLLPTFEALLALTNLASVPDDASARNPIIRSSLSTIDDLLLSSNTMICRASTELVCNLVQAPLLAQQYADGSQPASQRIFILLALADAEDVATRLAAGGALASLTEYPGVTAAILERREQGVRLLLGLCRDETHNGLLHRGLVCVLNMCAGAGVDGQVGVQAREALIKGGAVDIVTQCLKRSRDQTVIELAVEALKVLRGGDGRALIEG